MTRSHSTVAGVRPLRHLALVSGKLLLKIKVQAGLQVKVTRLTRAGCGPAAVSSQVVSTKTESDRPLREVLAVC